MADLNQSISDYHELIHTLSQPVQTNTRGVEWKKSKEGDIKDFWYNRGISELWEIEIHMVKQRWGSTSAGWGGIGGAAMTNTFTVVVHCRKMQIIAVYYQGQIAYVMDISGDGEDLGDFSRVPAFSVIRKDKRVIYTNHKYDFK